MVKRSEPRNRGAVLIGKLIIALGIMALCLSVIGPLIIYQRYRCREQYFRAVLLEIVDGEMEGLVAGRAKAYRPGRYTYNVQAESLKNMPQGKFILTVTQEKLHLHWHPEVPRPGLNIFREACRP